MKAVPGESDVLCTHPMFGPESGKDGWKHLTFVYDRVRIRDEAISSAFLHIFQSEVNPLQYFLQTHNCRFIFLRLFVTLIEKN